MIIQFAIHGNCIRQLWPPTRYSKQTALLFDKLVLLGTRSFAFTLSEICTQRPSSFVIMLILGALASVTIYQSNMDSKANL